MKKLAVLSATLLISAAAVPALAQGGLPPGPAQPTPPAAGNPAADPGWMGKTYATSWELFQAMKAKANGGDKKTAANLPDWRGIWTRGRGGLLFNAADPNPKRTSASLTPEYAQKYIKKNADADKGVEWDNLSYCLPAGYPRWLTEPFLREFIVTPEQTWWINEQQSEVRRIYTDGRGHVPEDEAYALWEGDSIGFWDGDTLVVHTNNVKPGQYQRRQPDYSDKTTTVERIRKTGPDTIEDEIWVYDPEGLTKPWHVIFTYNRVTTPNLRINMWSCEENNNVVKTDQGVTQFVLPGEAGYKDPNNLQSRGPAPGGQ
jgi:hypothetical protein